MIHCRFSAVNPRSVWILGRATFTIVTSRTTMNCAIATTTNVHQRLRPPGPVLCKGSVARAPGVGFGAATTLVPGVDTLGREPAGRLVPALLGLLFITLVRLLWGVAGA